MELLLNALAEETATEISKERNPQGLTENARIAKEVQMLQRLLVKMWRNVSEEASFHLRKPSTTSNLPKSCLLRSRMINKCRFCKNLSSPPIKLLVIKLTN